MLVSCVILKHNPIRHPALSVCLFDYIQTQKWQNPLFKIIWLYNKTENPQKLQLNLSKIFLINKISNLDCLLKNST